MLTALAAPAGLRAQETNAPASDASAGTSLGNTSGAMPLARYFPKENLIIYVELSGLDAHAEAWQKTAAYKMLTETPLGEMLEEVGTQLLDKILSYAPGHRFTGAEIITLTKYAWHHGGAMGVYIKPSTLTEPRDFVAFTLVIRDAHAKDIKGLMGRLLGTLTMQGRPRLEPREGRTLAVYGPSSGTSGAHETAGCWWIEKEDLVLCAPYPSHPDQVLGALDGKVKSAVDHPFLQELARKDGTFEPMSIAFLDAAGCPKNGKQTEAFQKIVDVAGIQRIGFRAGFDDDALMREIRIVAPKPRKPFLALLDQPGFDGKALMPLPEGVESFLQLSVDTNALIDSIAQLGPEGVVKGKVDEFAESIHKSGKIDFRKDFLGRIGPRMVLFAAPDKSAKVVAGTFDTNWLQGFNPSMGVPPAALEHLPKLTLIVEVPEPKGFDRTLEGAMNAVNHLLAARAKETAEKEEAEKDQPAAGGAPGAPGPGRGGAGRAGGGAAGQRGGTRKRSSAKGAPKFEVLLDSTASPTIGASSGKMAYILRTPSDSPLKLGPPNFRPVIKLDGHFLVFSVDSESANAALKAAKQKGWKPSEDLQKAGEHLPPKMVVLGVTDPRDVMPALLASLPGTLQTIINSVITIARSQAANAQQGGMNGPGPGAPGPGGPGGMQARMGGRMMGRGGPGGAGGQGPGGFGGAQGPGAPGPGAGGNPPLEIPADAKVELKVDPDKLPKADDLRSRYFLSTVAVAVNDQDIRFITREAFVSPTDMAVAGVGVALLLPAVQAARAAAQKAQAANEQAAAAQAPAAGPAAGAAGGGRPGGPGGGAMPGRGGGRRGRPGQ